MNHTKPGYIMILTLLTITIALALVSIGINKSSVYTAFSQTMIEREKARQLALGGIQVAMSQLSLAGEKEEKEKKKEEPKKEVAPKEGEKKEAAAKKEAASPQDPYKKLLQKIVPLLGKWQTYQLSDKEDGVKGAIAFCVMSEEGKLNLNLLFDFEKGKFVGEGQAQGNMRTALEALLGAPLFGELEKFLKKRKEKLDDITQLMKIPGFYEFKNAIFYEPPVASKEAPKRPMYLMDLFTLVTKKPSIDPWFVSDSLRAALKFNRISATREAVLSDEFIAKIRPHINLANVKSQLNLAEDSKEFFQPLYGAAWGAMSKELQSLFASQSTPTIFSVLSQGTVGKTTIRFYAILERVPAQKDTPVQLKIIRMYSV